MNFSKANMKSYFVISIISLIFVSCSSNTLIKKLPIHQRHENEINYLGKDRSGKIIFKDGQIIPAIKMYVIGDSLKYLNTQIAHYNIVGLNDIKKITFKDHTIGIFYGLVSGGLGVGLLGLTSIDRNAEANLAYAGYMAGGSILGALLGGFVGIDRNYIFIEAKE